MPKRRSLATLKDIKVGQKVYVVDRVYGNKPWQRIIGSRITRVEPAHWSDKHPFFRLIGFEEFNAGDCGVIGCQYDKRPCQVFLNKRSAMYWMKKWKGVNPNFIDRFTGCLTK